MAVKKRTKKVSKGIQYSSEGNRSLEITKHQSRFTNWMYDVVRPHIKGHVLEVGSGVGTYSEYILKEDSAAVFSEIDPAYVKSLQKRFKKNDVVQLDISNSKQVASLAKMHKFDTIIFLNVLEHVEHDEKALLLLKRLLRKNGKIVCLVPAHRRLYNTIDKSIGHWRRYTKKELIQKVSVAGYKIEKVFWFNSFAIPGWFVSGLSRRTAVNSSAMKAFDTLVPVFRFIDKYVFFGKIGISLVIIAKKK